MPMKINYYWRNLGEIDIDILRSVKLGLNKLKTTGRLKLRSFPLARSNSNNNNRRRLINRIEKELQDVSTTSHEVLFKTRTIFPFDLFPDTVTLDREKMTIVQRLFFFTARIISVPVRDILGVQLSVGPFFGSIHITSRFYSETTPHTVHHIWRGQAFKLQRLLQGHIIANERDIDCRSIPLPQLEKMLMDIGSGDFR